MKIYNRYVIIVAISLLLTTVIMTAFNVDSLTIYFISYALELMIITELFRYFSPQTHKALNKISLLLFGIFILTLVLKITTILF